MAKKILIASGKGGVGKSSLTALLGYSLANLGKRVLVMDFDIGLRSLDIMFGVSEQVIYDWSDIILNNCTPDKAFLSVSYAHARLSFISAPLQFDLHISSEQLHGLLSTLDNLFDFIIIDSSAGISEAFLIASKNADMGIVVSTPDEICVRSCSVISSLMSDSGVKDIRLIINKFNKKSVRHNKSMNIDEVIDSTSVQLIGIVPNDPDIIYCFPNGKQPAKSCKAIPAAERIAKRIIGEYVDLSVQ